MLKVLSDYGANSLPAPAPIFRTEQQSQIIYFIQHQTEIQIASD